MILELILAIVVICAIIIVFYILTKRERKRRAAKLLELSSGTFDVAAQEALEDLDTQPELTPEEHAVRGNIIRYNILENNAPRTRAGRNMFGRLIRDYDQAIRGVALRTIAGGFGVYHDHAEAAGLDAVGIIRGAATLYDTFGPVAQNPLEDDYELMQMMQLLGGALNEAAPVVTENAIRARVQTAVAAAPTRHAAVEAALAPVVKPVDTQNVHDSKVSGDAREILRKIKSQVDVEDELDSIRGFIIENAEGQMRHRALEALEEMSKGGYMTTFGDNEASILAQVWKRCSHPRNNEKDMRISVVSGLADCFDGTPQKLVCANGRCTRVINSLALIDYDPSLVSVLTFDAYKNLIMREALDIFNSALEDAENGTPAQRTVARSYEDPSVTADPEAEKEFQDSLRKAVDGLIDTYSDKFNPRELEQLRSETYTYVTL